MDPNWGIRQLEQFHIFGPNPSGRSEHPVIPTGIKGRMAEATGFAEGGLLDPWGRTALGRRWKCGKETPPLGKLGLTKLGNYYRIDGKLVWYCCIEAISATRRHSVAS